MGNCRCFVSRILRLLTQYSDALREVYYVPSSSSGPDVHMCHWHLLTFEPGLCFYGNGEVESRMDETGREDGRAGTSCLLQESFISVCHTFVSLTVWTWKIRHVHF